MLLYIVYCFLVLSGFFLSVQDVKVVIFIVEIYFKFYEDGFGVFIVMKGDIFVGDYDWFL